jgi:hypothetical protein
MDMVPVPPAAGNDVVVLPVITWHPFEPVGDEEPQATADRSETASTAILIRAEGLLDRNEYMKASLYVKAISEPSDALCRDWRGH